MVWVERSPTARRIASSWYLSMNYPSPETGSHSLKEKISHYESLFNRVSATPDEELLSYIPSLITEQRNLFLCNIPSAEEVFSAMHGLDPESSPGIDGFTGHFEGCVGK